MLHNLAAHIPNLLPNWHFFRPAGRLIWSSLIIIGAIGGIKFLCARPKPKESATWAQAMLGAVVSFGLMIIAYGTVPHEWLTFANGYLKWDTSHFLIRGRLGSDHGFAIIKDGRWFLPIDVPLAAIKDIVATGIYGAFLVGNFKLFAAWQKRPEAPAADTTTEPTEVSVGTSAYGKPMTAKA